MVKRRKDPFLAQKIRIQNSFAGIGADKAERLLIKFGTLHALFKAGEEELLLVIGIGKNQ